MNTELPRLADEHSWRIEERASCEDNIWSFTQSSNAEISYPSQGNEFCAAVEDKSFWFQHRNMVIEKLVSRFTADSVLWDVGGGNGCVSKHLQNAGIETVLVEPGREGVQNAAERQCASVLHGKFEELELPSDSIAAVGIFDVLEHIEHIESLLLEFYRVLRPGGKVIVTVPACKALWSQADDFAGHFRRYSKKTLHEAFSHHGFSPLGSGYFMLPLVAPVFLFRALPYRLGKRVSEEKLFAQLTGDGAGLFESLISMSLRVESVCIPSLPLPFGSSLYGVFRK